MITAITKISFVENLGDTPAKVNRITGEMILSKNHWRKLTPEQRLFVMLHEAGHATLKTRNEMEADNFAFQAYAELGKPLTKAFESLTKVLSYDKPGHIVRTSSLFNEIRNYDFFVNGNSKVYNNFNSNVDMTHPEYAEYMDIYSSNDPYIDSFLGLGKKARERREERKDKRQARKDLKVQSKANIRNAKAQGISTGTYKSAFSQGIGSYLGNLSNKAGNILENKLGGLGGGDVDPNTGFPNEVTPEKSNKGLIITAVVIIIIVIAGVVFFKTRKN